MKDKQTKGSSNNTFAVKYKKHAKQKRKQANNKHSRQNKEKQQNKQQESNQNKQNNKQHKNKNNTQIITKQHTKTKQTTYKLITSKT